MVRMTFRARKSLLWAATTCLAMLVMAAVGVQLSLPPTVAVHERAKSPAPNPEDAKKAIKAEPLATYAVIYQRDLRKPLFPPKEGPAVVAQAPKLALGLKLVCTAVEPGHTCGFFIDRTGQTRMGSVGDTIDGAEVTAIKDGEATVKYFGSEIVLRVPKEGEGR